MASLPIEAVVLQQHLEKHSKYETAVLATAAPSKGPYLQVSKTSSISLGFNNPTCILGIATLFVLPCYNNDENRYAIRFDLYIDGELRKTYSYKIAQIELAWWGLLPFTWVNSLTNSYKESYESIVIQLLIDAGKEGYL